MAIQMHLCPRDSYGNKDIGVKPSFFTELITSAKQVLRPKGRQGGQVFIFDRIFWRVKNEDLTLVFSH